MTTLTEAAAALAGKTIPGGCDSCEAYQIIEVDVFGIIHLCVFHDGWCPWLAERDTA